MIKIKIPRNTKRNIILKSSQNERFYHVLHSDANLPNQSVCIVKIIFEEY